MPFKNNNTIQSDHFQIGLSPLQLNNAYPYHIIINQNLVIIQIGKNLSCRKDGLLGSNINDLFIITSPPMMRGQDPWDWNTIIRNKTSTYDIELIESKASPKSEKDKLVLRGGVLLNDSNNDEEDNDAKADINLNYAIFLFCLNVKNSVEMDDIGCKVNDLNKFTFQRDVILASKLAYALHSI